MFEKSMGIIKKTHQFIKTRVYSWVLPFTCILCSKSSDRKQDLCYSCLKDLPIITQSCRLCANIIPANNCRSREGGNLQLQGSADSRLRGNDGGERGNDGGERGNDICGSCLHNPPPFSRTCALFVYEEPIVSMIVDLKFHHQLAYARILGELMAEKIASDWYSTKPLPDLLMPIPLHTERLKERGFNQALEIARPVSAKLGLNLDYRCAQRIKHTPAQMKLAAETRQANIKNAFRVEADLSGMRIAILDDVMTTGSTAGEFSRVLLERGAKEVEVWCCARVNLA